MPLAASSALNRLRLGSWTPIFLPIRSCGVAMLPSSASDRIENGFFWYVVPTILSGKSELAIAAPVEIALLRPKSALPVATSSSVRDRAGQQVDLVEAGVLVVALVVGHELAGELGVLDPGAAGR